MKESQYSLGIVIPRYIGAPQGNNIGDFMNTIRVEGEQAGRQAKVIMQYIIAVISKQAPQPEQGETDKTESPQQTALMDPAAPAKYADDAHTGNDFLWFLVISARCEYINRMAQSGEFNGCVVSGLARPSAKRWKLIVEQQYSQTPIARAWRPCLGHP